MDDDGDDGGGECPHVWRTVEFTAARDGAYVERVCTRCDAVTLVGPRELGGWV